MFGMLSVGERETRCFDYFNKHNIENRDQLRNTWKTNPIEGVRIKFAEDMFSDYQDVKKYKEKRKGSIITGADYHQTFVLSDIHIPFQDDKTVKLVFDCLADYQPKNVVLLGDILDCYSISRFTKDPSRMRSLQYEIDMFYKYMKDLRKILPNSNIYYILGNHEARLMKLILDNPGLYGLDALEPSVLFRLDELGIIYREKKVVIDGFTYYHGDVVRKCAGYSAKAEYEDHRMSSGVSGHCFSEDVEILTTSGWKRVLDTEVGETVATINKITKAFEWNVVKDKFVYDNYKELYQIKSSVVDLMVTGEHGLLGYNVRNNKFEEFTASELNNSGKCYKFLCAAEQNNSEGISLSEDYIRLLVNISADGCIEDSSIRFHLKKDRKITHLIELLTRLGLEYSSHVQKTGNTKICIATSSAKHIIDTYFPNGKCLPDILKKANQTQANIILDEYSIMDGNKTASGTNSYQITTKKLSEVDILQEIFSKNGIRSSVRTRKSGYVLSVNTRRLTTISKNNVSVVPYEGIVSCVSVDNGTLIVRSKGKTVVTQNTHRLSSYYSTYNSKVGQWFENGCLCKLEPDYLYDSEKANWQQGFTVVDYYDGVVQGTQVLIQDHKFSYGGRLYQ